MTSSSAWRTEAAWAAKGCPPLKRRKPKPRRRKADAEQELLAA